MKNWERYKYELLDILITNLCLCEGRPYNCGDTECECCDYDYSQDSAEKCYNNWLRFDWLFAEYDGNDNEQPVGFAREIKKKLEKDQKENETFWATEDYCSYKNDVCTYDGFCEDCPDITEEQRMYFIKRRLEYVESRR